MDNNAKLELFRQAISRQSEEDAAAITAEIRERRKAAHKVKSELAAKDELDGIKQEISRSDAEFRREMSRCDYELKKAVLSYRNERITEFFSETEKRLQDFVSSEQYPEYLKRSLEKIRASIALDSATLIYARACDVDIVRSLTSCEVTADNSIKLGGLRAVCRTKNVLCDVTLDMALGDEKRLFTEKTELRL
ncbi:MAG: hypothetical protein E7485_07430 [Ruminococcaceae bacterium]|nr:hypothetical protein [Oscillospiraceae bacterium]